MKMVTVQQLACYKKMNKLPAVPDLHDAGGKKEEEKVYEKKSNRINSCCGYGDVFPCSLRQQWLQYRQRKFSFRNFRSFLRERSRDFRSDH